MSDLPKRFYSIKQFEKTLVPNYYYDNIEDNTQEEVPNSERTNKIFKFIDNLDTDLSELI
jgi:hypothetical protein